MPTRRLVIPFDNRQLRCREHSSVWAVVHNDVSCTPSFTFVVTAVGLDDDSVSDTDRILTSPDTDRERGFHREECSRAQEKEKKVVKKKKKVVKSRPPSTPPSGSGEEIERAAALRKGRSKDSTRRKRRESDPPAEL